MSGVTVQLSGFRELEEALNELGKATARNVLKRAAAEALEPIAEDARQRAPERSGKLRESIKVAANLVKSAGKAAYHNVMAAGGTRAEAGVALRAAVQGTGRGNIEMYVGSGGTPHAHLVEFGSVNNAPQPFLRPAWDAGKDQVLIDFKDALTEQIDKAVVRAQRKAARAAARAAAAAAPAPFRIVSVVP